MAKLQRETDVANVLSQMSQLVQYPNENGASLSLDDVALKDAVIGNTKEDFEHAYAQSASSPKLSRENVKKRSEKGRKKHSCDLCGREFSKLCNLKSHLRVHSGEKPHTCELCSHAFANLWDLIRHTRTHSGEKPYKCDHCDRRFSDFGSHRRHIRLHTKDNPYSCDVCKKEFSRLDSYKNHLHTHSDQKPFVCETCDKTFAYPSTYKRHLNSHSGERKFKCSACNKSFIRQDYLLSHQRKHVKHASKTTDSPPTSAPIDSVIDINEGELLLCPSTEIESSSSYSVNSDLSPIPILLSMAESAVVSGSMCDATEYLDSSALLAAASEIELGTSTEIPTPRYDVGIDLEACSIIPKSQYQNRTGCVSPGDFKKLQDNISIDSGRFVATSTATSNVDQDDSVVADSLFHRHDISLLYKIGLQKSIRNEEANVLDKDEAAEICSRVDNETNPVSHMALNEQQENMRDDGSDDSQNHGIGSDGLCTPVDGSFTSSFEAQSFASCIAIPGATVSLSFAF